MGRRARVLGALLCFGSLAACGPPAVTGEGDLVDGAADVGAGDASTADAGPGGGPGDSAQGDVGADAPHGAPDVGPVPPAALPPSEALNLGAFATALQCGKCHSNSDAALAMRDGAGRAIGPYDLWASSMMGNAARDPYWRAVVSAEVARRPAAKAVIEAKCLRCHAPMASKQAELDGAAPIAMTLLADTTPEGQVARDGVSCTVCHQITPKGFGAPESWSGGFQIASDRIAYGPHDDFFATPMLNLSSFAPKHGPHIREAALCATCHTLFTAALDKDGAPTGETLPEQTPYLEWRNSDFVSEGAAQGPSAATCQGCHFPQADADGAAIATRVARRPDGKDFSQIDDRDYGRHLLVGGNTLVPAMIRDNRDALRPEVPAAAFDATIAAARRQLEQATADLEVLSATWAGGTLAVDVRVVNKAGHKLPTAYPSRRVWLRLRALDSGGAVVLVSGDVDAHGRLVAGGAPLRSEVAPLPSELAGGPIQPHRDTVSLPDQVPIWQAVMGEGGSHTFSLLTAAHYVKDNRLLPAGWRADHPDAQHTAPVGVDGDPDFAAGGDVVHYRLPMPSAPAEVSLSLLYQPIDPRHVAELALVPTEDVAVFLTMWRSADRTPEVLATATAAVGR